MRWIEIVVVLAGCERLESSTSTAQPTRSMVDAAIAPDAAIARVRPDAAVIVKALIDARGEQPTLNEEAKKYADILTGPPSKRDAKDDWTKRMPGADLSRAIEEP